MAERGRVETFLVVVLCFAAIFVEPSDSRHVGSCVGCHGDKRHDGDNLSALSRFWTKVQAAMIDTEKQLGMERKTTAEASSVNDVTGSQQSRFAADKGANTQQPLANDSPRSPDGIIANLTTRIAALEKTMADAVSEGERLESEVTELSFVTEEGREPPLPRHLRRRVEHLEENIGVIEMKLEDEKDKVRRYEEELALVIGKQTSLEEQLQHLESLIAFRTLVPRREGNQRHKKSSRSHDSLWSPSGHRGDVSQGAVRDEKLTLGEDSADLEDFYDYDEYDYDLTHEAREQR
ncbi:uncharacterized protein LOC118410599 [Branchiostoma floridae]|uniref:Uncharacterized protein LOC118410599 n=1 Tax=Branchiostoma floridae TaxID=7739 RepID=A0A9J7KQI0_BRAFL|nr:uncharacterized protein LOC118410599 [Branchiostoma floridae]XP_035668268.1 uncharacterized protein LOC118410599 [Branchiostoma floridae]